MRCCLREVENTSSKIRWNNMQKQMMKRGRCAVNDLAASRKARPLMTYGASVESGNEGVRIAGIVKTYGEVTKQVVPRKGGFVYREGKSTMAPEDQNDMDENLLGWIVPE